MEAGRYELAEAAARRDFEELRTALGADAVGIATASDVLVGALVLNGRAAHVDTLVLARDTLRGKKARLGDQDPALIPSAINLGEALLASAEFDEAIGTIRAAVALSERASGSESLDVAQALDHLGGALAQSGRYTEAIATLERGLRLKERAVGSSSVSVADTLERLGSVFQDQGDYVRGGAAVRRAATIRQAANTEHPAYVTTLNLVAQQLWFEGRLPESKATSEEAVALAERTLRPGHPTLALALRFLANTLADLGDLDRSLDLTKRALTIAESNFGPNHHTTAEYVHSLGLAELSQGSYPAARRHLQQALDTYQARYGRWHELVATAHSVLALADVRLGDYSSARREQSLAMSIFAQVGGPNHPYVAGALTKLATVYLDQGEPLRALPLLERALGIREANLGPRHRDVARTLVDLASTLAQLGRPVRAQALANRALAVWESLDSPDAPEFATVLALYARLQANRGDVATARTYYERARAARQRIFGLAHPLFAEAQSGLALTEALIGDYQAALGSATSAEAIGRDHLRLMLQTLPERQALHYSSVRPRGLDLTLSLADTVSDAIPSAWEAIIRSRSLVLDEMAARRLAGRGAASGTESERRALTSARQRLANLMVHGPGQMSSPQYMQVIEAARHDTDVAEQTLAEHSVQFRVAQRRAQVGADEVVAALPDDAALVSILRYDRTPLGSRVPTARPSVRTRIAFQPVPSYMAFVVRRHRPTEAVALGSVNSIDQLVSQWRADIAAEGMAVASATRGEGVVSSRRSGLALRRRVWDSLAQHLQGVRKVFVVPDGALSLVPFAALPVGRRSYLIEAGPIVHYLSAERDLVPVPAQRSSRGLLALGGAAFDDRSVFAASVPAAPSRRAGRTPAVVRGSQQDCTDLQTVRFQPLGGTLREVRDLTRLWSADVGGQPEAARVLVGREASEAAFKRDAPGHRVLHIATHGFFLNGACGPALGSPVSRGVGGLATSTGRGQSENPLLLSGLALAGANRRALAGPNDDDGILTAEEVASLDLEGVEWAVLSACDTGVGEIKAGEGVFGLRRAFQVAGARTVVLSLWSVDDQATRTWMRTLYDGRFQGRLATADAVHAASLSLLTDRRAAGQRTSPFYWAAFVATGDWR